MKPRPEFSPGFRLSMIDIVILILGGIAAVGFFRVDRGTGIAIAFVVAHFFLFCNVLRMSRPLELIWAGAFVTLGILKVNSSLISWPAVLGLSACVTLFVFFCALRRPSYHGVGWKWLNPNLLEWWREKGGRSANLM